MIVLNLELIVPYYLFDNPLIDVEDYNHLYDDHDRNDFLLKKSNKKKNSFIDLNFKHFYFE